jgi:hypothetical protein
MLRQFDKTHGTTVFTRIDRDSGKTNVATRAERLMLIKKSLLLLQTVKTYATMKSNEEESRMDVATASIFVGVTPC